MHFCKRLPLWANLNEDIQIRLIKGGLTEAMILFNTRDYDSKRDEVKFMDGKLRSKEAFYASGFNSEMIDGNLIGNNIFCSRIMSAIIVRIYYFISNGPMGRCPVKQR